MSAPSQADLTKLPARVLRLEQHDLAQDERLRKIDDRIDAAEEKALNALVAGQRAQATANGAYQQVADFAKKIEKMLVDRVREPRPAKADKPEAEPIVCWLTLGPDDEQQAVRAATALVRWLGTVYVHLTERPLPDCWAYHPGIIQELHVLRESFIAAYTGENASPAAVADWHSRYRPGATERIAKLVRRSGSDDCDLEQHVGTQPWRFARLFGAEQMDEIARWWATTKSAAAPAPTPNMVGLAEQRRKISS